LWRNLQRGDGWIHEVKFDGYRSQQIIDRDGTRIYTRRGLKCAIVAGCI
jgi:ATP-dependent DNA ligase